LVELAHLGDCARLARGAEVGLERDRVEGHEAVDQAPDLAGLAEEPDVRPAVADHGQVAERRAQDLAHERHGLPPRAPAANPDRHAGAKLGDGLGLGAALVHLDDFARLRLAARGPAGRSWRAHVDRNLILLRTRELATGII